MLYKASAPGSLMILGEYAVLEGHAALVGAIDKRIQVTLTPRPDEVIRLISFETLICDLSLNVDNPRFRFVLGAIQSKRLLLKSGFDLTIESGMSDTVGVGSSAAVVVATLAVLSLWLLGSVDRSALMQSARTVVQTVQGVGSGADVAASVWGGLVGYHINDVSVEALPDIFPITVIYSGYKTPTTEAINQVNHRFAMQKKSLQSIYDEIGALAFKGIQYARDNKWAQLGNVMNEQQKAMDALGVNTKELTEIIHDLRKAPEILGAKISGSGLGDSAIGLGTFSHSSRYRLLDIQLAKQGVVCEKA